METYISFENTRDPGVSSKHRHMNVQKIPFHRDLINFFKFWSSGKLRYESCRSRFHIQSPFYIKCFNWERPSVLKWRKRQTGSKCLNWLQGNSLHLFSSQGISCSENPLEQVELSVLLLSSTYSLISNPRGQFAPDSFSKNVELFVKKEFWWIV